MVSFKIYRANREDLLQDVVTTTGIENITGEKSFLDDVKLDRLLVDSTLTIQSVYSGNGNDITINSGDDIFCKMVINILFTVP